MTETITPTQIERYQSPILKKALAENKVVVVKGLKGSGKQAAIEASLSELNRPYEIFTKKNYKTKIDQTFSWDFLKNQSEGGSTLLLLEAEFIANWNQFLEDVLMDEKAPSLILVASFEPEIDETFKEVLSSAGALIHWWPLSFGERAQVLGMGTLEQTLPDLLVYGNLPGVNEAVDKKEFLQNLVKTWLKGHLSVGERINKTDQQLKVLQMLAFKMGEALSFNEIALKCNLDNETVERYVKLFEKAYIVKIVPIYTTGQRYEMKKGLTVYFHDNGIRNALIDNFSSMDWRYDGNELWRNWLLTERLKWNDIHALPSQLYTWRSLTKTAVDILEVYNDKLMAYQAVFSKKEKKKFPQGFKTTYPDAKCSTLNRSTYWSFLSRKK